MKIELTEERYSRGIVGIGDDASYALFLQKLQQKQPITYAAIGGSITEGAAASSRDLSYASLFAKYLGSLTQCKPINAGIGATTSMFGAYRAKDDILNALPDIVTIEFAVNDGINPDIPNTYEWLVRQCRMQPQRPLVILIFTMHKDGDNLQDIHIPIGRHYNLPMLSYRDAFYPEIVAGKMQWSDISPDTVHPNDIGHKLISEMLIRFINSRKENCSVDNPAERGPIPIPLNQGVQRYEGGSVVDARAMKVLRANNWKQQLPDESCKYIAWVADVPGAKLQMEFTGKTVILGYKKYAGDYGKVKVSLDGVTPLIIDSFYEKPLVQQWAGGHIVLEMICSNSGLLNIS